MRLVLRVLLAAAILAATWDLGRASAERRQVLQLASEFVEHLPPCVPPPSPNHYPPHPSEVNL